MPIGRKIVEDSHFTSTVRDLESRDIAVIAIS